MLEFILERANYWAIIALMMLGLYICFATENYIKRLIGLGIFQTSLFLFYITLGKVTGGTAPILYGPDNPKNAYDDKAAAVVPDGYDAVLTAAKQIKIENVYSNPLPHVLILTAIVVGVATLAVGLSLVVRIREAYGTIEADEVRAIDMQVALAEEKSDAEEAAKAQEMGVA